MKKLYFVLGILSISFINAQSPITLSNSNMPGNGDTLRYSNAQLNSIGNYTQTGTNFTWNFSGLVRTSQGRRDYKLSALTPYAFFFLGFNEFGEKVADTLGAGPLTITNFYNYYKKQTSPAIYLTDGSGMTFSSVPVPSYYSDKDELYHFPMTYPKYDSTTFKFSTPTTSLLPIRYSKTGYRVTKCDGWGTITTPFGTANCIRIVTTQYSKDSIKNSFIPIPVGFNNYTRSYQWFTTSSKIPYLEVSGNLVGNNFTVTQIRYRDIYMTTVGVEKIKDISGMLAYPNPVKDKLYFGKNLSESTILDIFNVEGKLLKTISNEIGSQIDLSEFEQGLYILKINDNNVETFLKLVKE